MAYLDTFEPLKVTAQFRTNPICDARLPLDGLLWYQAHRLALGPEQATLPGGNPGKNNKMHMPLKMINPGTPDWYFACSWAQPRQWWIGEGTDHWNKRFDSAFAELINFGKRRGKVIIEQGKYKAYHMPVFYKVAKQVHWYCVGDKIEIKQLLSTMTNVGKKTSQGWGRVLWAVESWHSDWSVWHDGELMRGVPQTDALASIKKHGKFIPFDIVNYGLRPSYYRRKNQRMLAVPNAKG